MVRGTAACGGGLDFELNEKIRPLPTRPPLFHAATSLRGGLSSACRPATLTTTLPHHPFTFPSLLSPPLLPSPLSLSLRSQFSPIQFPQFNFPLLRPQFTPHMATIISPSSPDNDIPTATLALPSVSIAAAAPRRLPPPCWTPEETVALIDAYKDKWYSLRRGNLRGNHWQEVADDVASRSPALPAKTSVQCRHKMEKLRKRYRAEIQRSAARRSASSWAHFHQMHSMEKGTDNPSSPSSSSEDEHNTTKSNSVKRINDLYNRHTNQNGAAAATPGVRIKMPGSTAKAYGQIPNPNPRVIPNSSGKSLVEAIQALGEGFMRMEKMKMDMAQQIEEMRMEMELKRTEMILDSQQRIVDAFARSIKKPKNHHYA